MKLLYAKHRKYYTKVKLEEMSWRQWKWSIRVYLGCTRGQHAGVCLLIETLNLLVFQPHAMYIIENIKAVYMGINVVRCSVQIQIETWKVLCTVDVKMKSNVLSVVLSLQRNRKPMFYVFIWRRAYAWNVILYYPLQQTLYISICLYLFILVFMKLGKCLSWQMLPACNGERKCSVYNCAFTFVNLA